MDWNKRFASGGELHGYAPSPPLPRAVEGVAPGLALDLACGAGRHAIFLAERGWRVHALDGAQAGIDRMRAEARRREVADRIEPRLVDLEAPGLSLDGAYDLVCDFYFLHRPLFEQIRRVVKPGGLFAAAIHVRTATDEKGRFLLQPDELRSLFADWEVLHYREGSAAESDHHHGTAELIARRSEMGTPT